LAGLGFFHAQPLRAASETSGQAGPALSLDKAIALALENNLSLKKNLIDLSGAEYSASRLWSKVFPDITASAGVSYSSALFSGDGFALDDKKLNLSVGFAIDLRLNAGIPYAIKNIKLAYQSSLLNYEDARNQLVIQITKKFFSLIAEKNNLDYLENILNLAQMQFERNQISYNNGFIGQLTLMNSRLSVENARYNLSAVRSAFAYNTGEFFVMLGMAQDTDASLLGNIEIVRIDAEAETLIREYLPQRPDIISRRQEIQRLEYAEKQDAFSSRAPSLILSVDWGSRNFDPFNDTLTGSARLSIPVDSWIPGTTRSQNILKAAQSVEKAKLDLQIAEDSAKTQIRSLASNLRNSWDSVEIARLSVGVAERSYELTDTGFRNGTIESLVLEDARNNLANSRQRLLQSELSYLNMTLDLCAALNIDLKNLTATYGISK
jgi:multidrug efflux system outer membrane protein